jgi:hypothetical protein
MTRLPSLLWTVSCALALGACAHTATLESDPPGADVYVDGDRVGVTPFPLEDAPSLGSSYDITLEKDGFEKRTVTLHQDRWVVPMLVAGGLLAPCSCGLSLLYGVTHARTLDDRYAWALKRTVPLQPITPGAPMPEESAPPSPPVPAAPEALAPQRIPAGSTAHKTQAASFRY